MTSSEPIRSRSNLRSRAIFWLKLIISALLLTWILLRTDLAPVLSVLSGADPGWFVAAFLSQLFGAAIIALRWRALLSVGQVDPGYGYLLKSTLASLFFRQFMPSVVGGDALRAHDAWRAGASASFSLVSLFVDRLLGLLALAIFACLAMALLGGGDGLSGVFLPLAGGIIVALAILLALFGGRNSVRIPVRWVPEKITAKLAKTAAAMKVYRGANGVFGRAAGLSILLQVNVVTFYWMLAQSLSLGVPYFAFYTIVPLAIFIMMVPISINGIGLRETAFVFLLGMAGVDPEAALAFAWLEFGLVLVVGAFGGLVYLLRAEAPAGRPVA